MTGPNPILDQIVREHAGPSQRPQLEPVTVTRILQDVAANPLITRLAEHNLGQRLAPHEADHVCRLVAMLEHGRHPAAPPPPWQPDVTSQPPQPGERLAGQLEHESETEREDA